MKKIILTFLIITLSIGQTNAWLGLVAETGDLLNTSKWNEMINLIETKLERINIVAGNNIILTNSGTNDLIIKSIGRPKEIPYITDTTQINISKSTQSTIIINGTNFQPNSEIIIPNFDGTIDNIAITFGNKIELTLTPGSNVITYDIIISNDGTLNTLWSGNGVDLLNVTN